MIYLYKQWRKFEAEKVVDNINVESMTDHSACVVSAMANCADY